MTQGPEGGGPPQWGDQSGQGQPPQYGSEPPAYGPQYDGPPATGQPQQYGPPQPGPQQYGDYGPPPRKNRTALIVAAVAAALLVVGGIIAAVILLGGDDDSSGEAGGGFDRDSYCSKLQDYDADQGLASVDFTTPEGQQKVVDVLSDLKNSAPPELQGNYQTVVDGLQAVMDGDPASVDARKLQEAYTAISQDASTECDIDMGS